MDQDSAKKESASAQSTWRDKLGIKKELPKISAEFASPAKNISPERREPSLAAVPPRPGGSVKPAPMAPRIVAPKMSAPHVTANTELAERIRQQREAAERMAEQRIAEAKERAVQPPASAPAQEPQSPRPRFSFAEDELKQARHESPARAQTSPSRWNQVPQQRPMFTAERFASGAAPESRLGPAPASQRPAMRAGSASYAPAAMPAMPRRPPPQPPPRSMAPAADPGWQAHQPRRPGSAPPVFDPYRRDGAHVRGPGANDMDENPYRGERGRAHAFGDPNDYRGAHARELSNVEDQGDDLFEDERGAPPRRAEARDYHQAHREYEVTYAEEPRRRWGPFLLLLALLAVAAVGGVTLYFYQGGSAGPLLAKGEAPVPVVVGDGQPVKAEPQATSDTEEPAATKQSGEQQVSAVPSTEASAQKKQIYDRILGETTLEEQEQLAPGEEQPLKPPSATQNSGPSLESQSDAASGQAFDAEPLPLPLPPPPGESLDDETGGLDLSREPQTRTAGPARPSGTTSAMPVTVSPTPASTEPDVQPSPTSAVQSVPAQKPTPGQAAAAEGSEAILTGNDPGQDLIVSGGSGDAAVTPPEPELVQSGTGPIQIAPSQGTTVQALNPNIAALPPSLPDATTTIRKTRIARRGSKSADSGGVSVSSANFNRQASPQQVATVDPGLVSPQIAAEPAPPPPEQQAALPPPETSRPEASTAPAAPGFVMLFSSHRSEAEALAEFDRLRQSHSRLVGSLSPGVRKTNLGSSGTRYQLSLGVIPTREAAKSLCSSLFAAGEKDCIVRPR